jgi:hypothetical protein
MVPQAGEVHLSAAARSRLSLVWKIVLDAYRDRYREGIPRRSIADEEVDARILYRVLAGGGGRELVGPAQARGGICREVCVVHSRRPYHFLFSIPLAQVQACRC